MAKEPEVKTGQFQPGFEQLGVRDCTGLETLYAPSVTPFTDRFPKPVIQAQGFTVDYGKKKSEDSSREEIVSSAPQRWNR